MAHSRVSEEVQIRHRHAAGGDRTDPDPPEAAPREPELADDLELVVGSGNIFRDFGDKNADLEQLRAQLAAAIIRVLDAQKLTVRAAQEMTGIAAEDFSRIRHARLGRFTLDRLMTILDALGQQVDVSVAVYPRQR